MQLLLQRDRHALHVGAGHSASCRRDQCCHAARQLLCRPAAMQLPQLPAAALWLDQQLLGPRVPWALEDCSHQGPGVPWPLAVSTTADVSPGSGRGQGKASKAGRQPALRPAGQRPLLPILGEPAQSWSNLRDSQSVAGMADPPTASVPQQAPAPPQLSPLSGAYLLIVVGEPFSEEHKKLILQKLQQGKRGSLCERGVLSTQSREVFRLQIGSVQGKTCRVQRGGI